MPATKEFPHDDTWSLVERVKNGDRQAFMTLIRIYQKKVFVLTYAFFRNKEDALDLVQETFLRLHEKIGSFLPGRNFEAWLLQIAKNLCIDFYRKNYRRRRELECGKTVENLDVPDRRAEAAFLGRDLKEILTGCVDKLAERQRTIFIMRHYNQLTNEAIAQTLGISVGTVKSLHFKAVRNLRALVGPYLGWEG
jgi:RNA polymerase sigma-70 factor, ECF subfamily